ncbi:MAG TPA: hypothetical protein DDY98_01100, partial [Ruminococcaceae bacterium]|nr:hypothetical protein [Oscillospiraceae bacterium]
EPTPEPMHEEPAPPVGFSLDSSAQWNEGDDLHEELPDTNRIDLQEEFFIQPEPEAPTEPEPQLTEEPQKEPEEAPLLSASAMNILLDTEADNEALEETIARYSDEEKDDEEDSFHSLSLEKVANEQQAEYFAEGEEPEPLTAPYSPRSGNFFTRNVIPQKGDSPAEIIRKIIMILALLAVIGSAGYLFNDYVITPYRTANQIDELSEMIDESNMDVVGDNLKKEYP